eukprot:Skav221898  [mRNA]  locus=scaffold1395:773311:777817:+ [translate_table: standard]
MDQMHSSLDPARVHCAALDCQTRTIQGGVIYGHAFHSHTQETRDQTDELCQVLTERLLHQSHGLRFLGGDFNQPDQALPSMQYWADKGWVNVQKWAWDHHGIEPKATCKGSTIPDHLFLSPELAVYLRTVDVQDDWFEDRAVLVAHLADVGKPPMLPLWRMPHSIPWEEVTCIPSQPTLHEQQHSHPEEQPHMCYQHIWQRAEARVSRALQQGGQRLHKSCQGRATTYEVRWVQEYTTPIRPSRSGEFQPTYQVPNLQYTQWVRQLRRLVNWARLLRRNPLSPKQFDHLTNLWQSIVKAPGFAISFPHWWQLEFPQGPHLVGPRSQHADALCVCQAFQDKLTRWEKVLLAQRTKAAKQRRQDDPNVIFKDLRQPPPQPVQILVDKVRTTVTSLDPDELAIEAKDVEQWHTDQPIYVAGIKMEPIMMDSDKFGYPHWKGFSSEALGLTAPGYSAIVHMSMVEEPRHDPQCHALIATALQFRQFHSDHLRVDFVMQHLHQGEVKRNYGPGPCSVLLARLHQVSWHWITASLFYDQWDRPCDLLQCPVQELIPRLLEAWQFQHQVKHRQTMKGIEHAHPQLTTMGKRNLPPEDQAILARCLNGTYWAADHLKHVHAEAYAELGDKCKFCGAPDTQTHRHWKCPHFRDLRPFTDHEIEEALRWPAAWAAWGIVIANVADDTVWPLANGLLPGWYQSSLRAEIFAVLQALHCALRTDRPVTVWADNDLVYRRCQQFLTRPFWIKPNQKNADLWTRLADLLGQMGGDRVDFMKVVSHQALETATTEVERWAFSANMAADRLAEQAFANHPDLLQLWEGLQEQLDHLHKLRMKVHNMYIAIGKRAVQAPKQVTELKRQPVQVVQQATPVMLPTMTVRSIPTKYHCDRLQVILQWLTQFGTGDCKLISWYQMNFWFEHQTQCKGVEYDQKIHQWFSSPSATRTDFPKRTGQLSAFVQGLWAAHGLKQTTFHARSSSCVLTFWTRCVPVKVPTTLWHNMEQEWLRKVPHLPSVKVIREFFS